MRSFIRYLFTIIMIAIIFFNNPVYVNAFQVEDCFYMKDISGHWAREYMEQLVYAGILKGDTNRNANPDQPINRAEFIALLVRALNYTSNGDIVEFKDVQPQDWFYEEVSIARQHGITIGDGNGYFHPNNYITREEIVLMLVRGLNTELSVYNTAMSFRDIPVDYKYKKELSAAVDKGIIKGYENNTFRPYNNATRAEAAVMIKNMLSVDDIVDKNQEQSKIIIFIEQYMDKYLEKKNKGQSDIDFNFQYSVGKENDYNKARANVIELYGKKGMDVKQHISDRQITIENVNGRFAKVNVVYDVSYTRVFDDGTEKTKHYKMEVSYRLRKMNEQWVVYDSQERLYRDDKISLVWEQISVKTPDMSNVGKMEGLDVISPTWFELRANTSSMGVKSSDPTVYSDGQNSIHMIDMGDYNFVQWAENNQYDIWALYRNEFDIDVANKILNNKEARKITIELLLEFTDKYKLDGINIDFENMYYSDKDAFSQYVREIALVMREQGVITSVDVTKIEPTSLTWSMCYDREALGKAVDYVVLMGYDQNGSWSKTSGSVAQLSWVENALKGIMEQVPNEQILLGVPFYTRVWEETNGKVTKTTAISMMTANDLIKQNNATLVWDEKSGQYVATYYKDGKTYKIWVEDATSIKLKSQLVNKYNLAGVAGWRRGFETQDIWSVIAESLK